MKSYKQLLRVTAGNKQVARSVNAYIKTRDKLIRQEWEKRIKPVMEKTEREILAQLNSYDNTDWQIFNLNRILSEIRGIIAEFDKQFASALVQGENLAADTAVNYVGKSTAYAGFDASFNKVLSGDTIAALVPLSQQVAHYFSEDLAKVVSGQISRGLATGAGTSEVAAGIRSAFGIDGDQRLKIERRKNQLDEQLEQGKISQSEYRRRVRPINKMLESGSSISYARAQAIARTELLTATSMAEHSQALEISKSNPGMLKVWLWSHKPNGREAHMIAEETYRENPIPVEDDFIVDGEPGAFPRDFRFSPGNRVNCACTMAYINAEDMSDIDEVTLQ